MPYKIYNIGNSEPVKLMDFIKTIEEVIGYSAKKDFFCQCNQVMFIKRMPILLLCKKN